MKVLRDYQGKPVRLTDERLAHIKEHPEMVDMEAALEETLLKPQLVIRSGADTSANLNYRYYYGTLVGDKWLCAVVKYGIEDAFVLTAYLTDKPKRGVQLWPSK
ncbi:MAG: hypothetical protein HGB21_00930 [Nitrospirae bacterium]|nr:hypothetical protein [Nitrospirota bacterium]NTW64866.1 hypothetical protein [Nitrospirota bacterium]